jgi:hypothetical protein
LDDPKNIIYVTIIYSYLIGIYRSYLQVDKETLRLLVKRRAMLRVLSVLFKQKENTLPTRVLLQKLGANNLHHVILQAEREGYIKRKRVKPQGKGNYLVYNRLTPKGRRLAKLNKKLE